MFSYDQYMDGECTLFQYYIQFESCVKSFVEHKFSPEYIRARHAKDSALNNLHKGWVNEFDRFTQANARAFATINQKLNGKSVYSLSDGTIAIKMYMRKYAGIDLT